MIRATAAAGGLALAATFAVGCSQTKEADKAIASSAASVSSVISSAETAASSAVAASGDVTTLIYPDETNPMFSVDAPPNWLVIGVGQVGGFGTL